MKHKNAEMIKAVVDNVDLVIFVRVIDQEDERGNYWSFSSLATLAVASNDFFLCLPQHKDACLHWLNGGELQINRKTYNEQGEELPNEGFLNWDRPSRGWKHTVSLMSDKCQFRIKPKKEKRLISVYGDSVEFVNPDLDYPSCVQLIEIEVEV